MVRKVRILHVDDNLYDRQLIKDALQRDWENFEIVEADNREKFEKLLDEDKYDLVLSDFNILGFDGLQVLQIIKQKYPSLPVIIVTGTGTEETAIQAMKMGAYDYIIKSVKHIQGLVPAIKMVLELRKAQDENKRAEEELRASEIRYKTLTDYAPVGIFGTDISGSTTYVNPRWCEISKISCEEALGNGWIDKVHPDDRARISERWQKDVSARLTSKAEYRFLHGDGSVTWVSGLAVPQKDENGIVMGYIGTITDITELKKDEEALIEKEERYRTLFEGANDSIFIMSKDRFIECNKNALSLFGCNEKEDIIGHSPWEFSPVSQPDGRDSKEKACELIRAGLEGVPQRFYWKHCKKNHELIDTEVSLNRIVFGSSPFIQAMVRDITEQKKAADELLRAKEKAEESDRLKTAFLHNVSHEIRTPMNAIIGFSALLGESGQDDDSRRSFVDIIMNSSNHLLAIVNDIIEISNIEAGILKLNLNQINLNMLLNNLYRQFKILSDKKGIELKYKTTLSEIKANVLIDSTKLIQVLTNMLSNAFKFTSNGQIVFGCRLKNDFLEFFVSDTGIGIPADQYEKIFDRFYQSDHSASRLYEGTGLGLSISKSYIEFMGGKIWLESKPGKGSVFYFNVPYQMAERQESKEKNASENENVISGKKKTILIVNDEEDMYLLMAGYLSGSGMNILHARNGSETIDICESGQDVNLVLMDLRMPETEIYAAVKKIKEIKPALNIVVQTAYAIDRNKALMNGCSDLISKPFTREELMSVIKNNLA